ncbi:hypothetical protein PX699_08515 [Sphingobium sp. H39-3-25]|uniref:hypothetical protein n=1 Tax=Sphingobium arseniciresistens TaxID=3030834 RepID=UPI0023B98521|nr:hypothetical protein [Sphingobium arseniciresistens]
MIDIAKPQLTPHEWEGVKSTLSAVSDCGCVAPSEPGSRRRLIGRTLDLITRREPAPRKILPPRLEAVREFLCETGRMRHVAEAHVPALVAQGFSRAQIEAIALLGA